MQEGRPKKTVGIPTVSQAKAAEMMNVGREGVNLAKRVLTSGVPELIEAVEAGEIKVSVAAEISELLKTQAQAAKEVGVRL